MRWIPLDFQLRLLEEAIEHKNAPWETPPCDARSIEVITS